MSHHARIDPPFSDQTFDHFELGVAGANFWLTAHHQYNNTEHGETTGWRGEHFTALCFDSFGRRCRNGADMQRAKDEGAVPVWWIWPDQIVAALSTTQAERDAAIARAEAAERDVEAAHAVGRSMLEAAERDLAAVREGLEPALEWGRFADAVDIAWRRMLEMDDRNSPEEYPDMILIDRDELERAMEEACDAIIPDGHSQSRASSLLPTPSQPSTDDAKSVKRTMTLTLTEAEMAALEELAERQDMTPPTVFRQALKGYQLISRGLADLVHRNDMPKTTPFNDDAKAGEE